MDIRTFFRPKVRRQNPSFDETGVDSAVFYHDVLVSGADVRIQTLGSNQAERQPGTDIFLLQPLLSDCCVKLASPATRPSARFNVEVVQHGFTRSALE
ncbi:uncharacterized protein [Nothobranchius furzeri]|uniref:uncharacterized protein isoform X3 n=1 Tax=Nothobranchius furzeri TaxID=105023 RepID=UPI0039048AE6